jgi:outer membrane protein assembly factor BamD
LGGKGIKNLAQNYFFSKILPTFANFFLLIHVVTTKFNIPLYALAIVALAALFGSCNSFEKLLKNSDFGLRYREANRYYNIKKYDKAAMLYESVMPFYRNSPSEDTINIRVARCYFNRRDYEMAQYYYDLFVRNFPRSGFVEEADFNMGLCSYRISSKYELDQTETRNAIDAFNSYLYKHPGAEHVGECRTMIVELEGRLAEKAFMSAKSYYTTEYYKAAVVALKNYLKAYPDSKFREETMFLILKSSYLHAERSVTEKQRERYQLTIDDYYNLMSEYPSSKYKGEAEKMYAQMLKFTKSDTAETLPPTSDET